MYEYEPGDCGGLFNENGRVQQKGKRPNFIFLS
jgi:hypothetical protein